MSLTPKLSRDDLTLLLAALVLNLLVIQFFCCSGVDQFEYFQLGTNIAQGNGYSMETEAPYYPSTFRVPVYPFVLALIIKSFGTLNYQALYYLQAILNTLSLFMVYRIARRFVPNLNPYITASCILLLSLPLIYMAGMFAPESVNAFLVVSAFYLFVREKYFYAGLLFGLATLCRPENILIAVVVAVCTWNARRALVLLAGLMLLVAPWLIRNYRILGSVALVDPVSSNCNLLAGSSPDTFSDPLYMKRVELTRGNISQEERGAYVALARDTYFGRWKNAPFKMIAFKIKMILRPLLYGLEGYTPSDGSKWSLHAPDVNYLFVAIRLLCILLYAPAFFGLAIFGLLKDRKLLPLAIPFVVMAVVGFVAYADQRHFVLSRLLLIPPFVAGLSLIVEKSVKAKGL